MYRIPEQVCTEKTSDRFSAWRSNCNNPISSRFDDLWSRMEYWWNIVKWPLVLLLICSILGLFVYFLVVEMEINESLLNSNANSEKVMETNFVFSDQSYEVVSKNASWPVNEDHGRVGTNEPSPSKTTERPYVTLLKDSELESTTVADNQKQIGFTSGHQNNFGVPIEEDARILKKILEDELIRVRNGTTTPRMSTTNGNEYRTKVSPTLPLITRTQSTTTERLNVSRSVNEKCVSTSLPLCREVLPYDLTQNSSSPMTDEETVLFKYLIDSRCSSRAAQFICSVFEPECRPASDAQSLPPCKRFCKSILEPCSHVVATSELLTELFDCDIYPESHSSSVCNDPTRFTKCDKNEFKCLDATCIPIHWRCDNIKDCRDGDDEENCKFCEQDEFKCIENDKCIPVGWRCDSYKDCPTGSDELDCTDDDSRSFPLSYGNSRVIYPFVHEVAPDSDRRRPYYQTVSNDDRVKDDQEHAYSSHVAGRHILVPKSLANFQDSTEIMMTSESKLKYSNGGESLQTAHVSPCPDGELRCLSGRCISLSQLCDKVLDCSDGSDEAMCEMTPTSIMQHQPPTPGVY